MEENFKSDISNKNFNNNSLDINEKFGTFYSQLNECVEKHAPLKKMSPKEIKDNSKPWVTQHIKKLIKYRNKLFRKFQITIFNQLLNDIIIKDIESNLIKML